jgi:hypothetical protein
VPLLCKLDRAVHPYPSTTLSVFSTISGNLLLARSNPRDHKNIGFSLRHNLIISMEPPFWRESGTVRTEVSMGTPSMKALARTLGYKAHENPAATQKLAAWIGSFIADVPVTGIAVGEPFSYVSSHKA